MNLAEFVKDAVTYEGHNYCLPPASRWKYCSFLDGRFRVSDNIDAPKSVWTIMTDFPEGEYKLYVPPEKVKPLVAFPQHLKKLLTDWYNNNDEGEKDEEASFEEYLNFYHELYDATVKHVLAEVKKAK